MTMTTRQTRGGFSLIELIVVIGLMALLSTISIGGYFAASRGMEARGVVQDTVSIIRQTMQTCLIDQTPTAILFCNRRQNTAAEGGEAQGIAIAIKMAGRISYIVGSGRCKTSTGDSLPVSGGMLVDEFADWNQSYPLDASDSGEQRAIRLYQMSSPNGDRLDQGVKQCSSLMCAWVGYTRLQTEYMINARRTVEDWCNDNDKTDTDNKTYSSITYDNGNDQRWGLPIHPRNTGRRCRRASSCPRRPARRWRCSARTTFRIRGITVSRSAVCASRASTTWKARASPWRARSRATC